MASHKSALKCNRQNEKRYEQNRVGRTRTKNAIKTVLLALDEKNLAEAQNALKEASKIISKNAAKGVIHKRSASRKVAGLTRKVYQLSASA